MSAYEIIDLFAGPGGLSEGFANFSEGRKFKIIHSVEMDTYACQTLKSRKSYLKALEYGDKRFLARYQDRLINPTNETIEDRLSGSLWDEVSDIVIQAEMGRKKGNELVDNALDKLKKNEKRVVIGGPPCQAYSLVGRSRNAGIAQYDPKEDHRNYLYEEYLRVLNKVKPAVFVMENVKGMNSAKIDGEPIVTKILSDLRNPGKITSGRSPVKYRLYSLTKQLTDLAGEFDPDPKDFVIRCEEYGIPQARHRVIILGVREDIKKVPLILKKCSKIHTLKSAIQFLPPLRSGLTDKNANDTNFKNTLTAAIKVLAKEAKSEGRSDLANAYLKNLSETAFDSNRFVSIKDCFSQHGIPNHFSRRHMLSDLVRYFHAAVWSQIYGVSPKGFKEFPFTSLTPNHKNWKSGKFIDRFKCQNWNHPSSTIVSHISKDGHYFIHPDPTQCRSLSVREAATLQTFPRNYIFEGPQTAQFHQVGNAVPVKLAEQIAEIVADLLD